MANKEPDKALLYIDLTQDRNVIEAQKKYINQFVKNGFIKTDKEKYTQILKKMINDFESFISMQLAEYRYLLSEKDYDFFHKLQKETSYEKQIKIISDYKFLLSELELNNIKKADQIYEFILLFQESLNEYKILNSKDADIEKKNKIIETITQRFRNLKKEGDK